MKTKFSHKHSVVASILWALLILSFYFVSGAAIVITKATSTHAMLIRAICVFAACLPPIIYIWRSTGSFSDYGFTKLKKAEVKKVLFFLPLIVVDVVPIFSGFKADNQVSFILATLACTLCVGFAEEIYYRGIILNILKLKGDRFAIIGSSVLFGLGHLMNIAGGANVAYTLLQVFFAFFAGIVLAEIVVITNNIVVAMLWHFLCDFLAYTTNDGSLLFNLVGAVIQTVVLIAFFIYLYIVIERLRRKNLQRA